MKKITLALFLYTIYCILNTQSVAAQATSSASPTPDEITETVKERLQKLAQQGTNPTPHKARAVIGSLQSIANNTLTIKTDREIKLISVSDKTTFVKSPGNKAIKLSDLGIGNYVIAMGTINGSEVLETSRVIASDTPPTLATKKVIFGTIDTLDEKANTLTIKASDGTTTKLSLTKKTIINQRTNQETIEIDPADLTSGQTLIVVYKPEEIKTETTNTALLITTLSTSTPSAPETSPSPSPTATPKPSPKASPKTTQ